MSYSEIETQFQYIFARACTLWDTSVAPIGQIEKPFTVSTPSTVEKENGKAGPTHPYM